MAQNLSPTWDRKSGDLHQVIWKSFHHSQPSKKPLNNGGHMLVHMGFVEPTSITLVSFNLWIQGCLVFLFSLYMMCVNVCIYMHVCVCVCIFIYIYIYIYIYYIYIYTYIYIYIIYNIFIFKNMQYFYKLNIFMILCYLYLC